MRKNSFWKGSVRQQSTSTYSYKASIQATLNYYLHMNSGLKHLSAYQKHIIGSENKLEFIILRDNYCLRTLNTPINLKELLNQALMLNDYYTSSLICKNLHEEFGEGNSLHAHSVYMSNFFNILSESYFKTDSLDFTEIESSKHITESTQVFVREMKSLYTSDIDYHTKIGALLAHESTAPTMLKLLHDILKPHITCLSADEQKDCMKYIDCHLNGVEQQHGEDMLDIADRICKRESDFIKLIYGVSFFHSRQCHMWEGLINTVELFSSQANSRKT